MTLFRFPIIVLDSWATGPSGLQDASNTVDYGHFDKCINSIFYDNVGLSTFSQYAVVDVSLNDVHFKRGICLPQGCNSSEINTIMDLMEPGLRVKYHSIVRQISKKNHNWSGFDYTLMAILMLVVTLVVLSTIGDVLGVGM